MLKLAQEHFSCRKLNYKENFVRNLDVSSLHEKSDFLVLENIEKLLLMRSEVYAELSQKSHRIYTAVSLNVDALDC